MGLDSTIQCGESTIYIYSKKLLAKGLLEDTNTATTSKKTIYRITKTGRKALEEAVKETTLNYQIEDFGFTVAVIFMDIFSVEERCELMRQRIAYVTETIGHLSERMNRIAKDTDLPLYHELCINRLIEIAKGELAGCQSLLTEFEEENHAE